MFEKMIKWVVVLTLVAFGTIATIVLYKNGCFKSGWAIALFKSGKMIFWATVLLADFIFFLSGIRVVPQAERWVVETFGRYNKTLSPGLSWIFPVMDRVRAKVSVLVRRVALFANNRAEIEFTDGTSAVPQDAWAYYQIIAGDDDAPQRWTYTLGQNGESALLPLFEGEEKERLSKLKLDDANRGGRNGVMGGNVANPNAIVLSPSDIAQLQSWGVELVRTVVGDFAPSKEARQARQEKAVSQQRVATSQFNAAALANELMGAQVLSWGLARGKKTLEESQAALDSFLPEKERKTILNRMQKEVAAQINARINLAAGAKKIIIDAPKGDGGAGSVAGTVAAAVAAVQAMREDGGNTGASDGKEKKKKEKLEDMSSEERRALWEEKFGSTKK